jgi:LmbE family N-acetylglucosaminyl deacetylase
MKNFIKNYKSILCIFAHPDDETLAAGGLLSLAAEKMIKVNVGFSSTGIASRKEDLPTKDKNLNILSKNTLNALSVFKVRRKNIFFGNFPDNENDSRPLLDLIKWCENIIKKTKPDLILTHHRNCTNIDHRMLHEAVITATRPNINEKYSILSCEILSSTGYLKPSNFEPNLYLGLSRKNLNDKISAMKKYTTEIRKYPHPRSEKVIKALSILRGSECGNKFAEAFIINKIIS